MQNVTKNDGLRHEAATTLEGRRLQRPRPAGTDGELVCVGYGGSCKQLPSKVRLRHIL
jgi:hypothetical protein